VKTGYKYGSHFRVYRSDARKGHAPYLIHALPAGFSRPWPEVSGIIRVAHSVKKQILFHSGGKYLSFRRTRL
jgi:tRNA-intron endonuclease